MFLRGPVNFHKLKLAKINTALIYEKYSTSFASYSQKKVTPDMLDSLVGEYQYFK
jgi:hypothetical protein